jgi:hypothetical protein
VLFFCAAPAMALTNSECLTCHAVGGSANAEVDFEVPTVDRNTVCYRCHWWGEHSQLHGTPDGPDAAYLHAVHTTGEYVAYGVPGSTSITGCQGCHAQAACDACHGEGVPHTDHTFDASTSTYAFEPVTVTESYGFLQGQSADAALLTRARTCANPSCHAQLDAGFTARPTCESCHETHGGPSHVYDDFSPTCQRSGCHPTSTNLETIHQAYADSQSLASVCVVCHNAQNIFSGKTANCFDCHSSGGPAQPFAANHPYVPLTHESTRTSCFGAACHASQVPSNHPTDTASGSNDCERCHQVAYSTTGKSPTDCLACHTTQQPDHAYALPGVPAKHVTTWSLANCIDAGCHVSTNLWDEHANRTPMGGGAFGCDTCHASADTMVTGAILASDTACDACHPGITQLGHVAQHEADPTIDSGAYGTGCSTVCHAQNNLMDVHLGRIGSAGTAIDCETCHDSLDPQVSGAIAGGDTSCTACHTVHGPTGLLHETTATASGTQCNDCHYSNLQPEHETRAGDHCDLCHESTSAPVQNGIAARSTFCEACHPQKHTGQTAMHQSSRAECGGPDCHVTTDVSVPHTVRGCKTCHSRAGWVGMTWGGKLPVAEIPVEPTNDCKTCHPPYEPGNHGGDHSYTSASDYADGATHESAEAGCSNSGAGCHGTDALRTDIRAAYGHIGCTAGPCHASASKTPTSPAAPLECSKCHDGNYQNAPDVIELYGDAPNGHYGVTTHTAANMTRALSAGGTASAACATCHDTVLRHAHDGIASTDYGAKVTCAECHNDTLSNGRAQVTAGWTNDLCEDCHAPGTSAPMHSATTAPVTNGSSTLGCGASGTGCHSTYDLHALHQDAASCGATGCHTAKNVAPTSKSCGQGNACHTDKTPGNHGYTATTHTASGSSSTCFASGCHTRELKPEHDKYLASYPQYASTCGFCHTIVADGQTRAGQVSPWNLQCQACHAAPHVLREPMAACNNCHSASGIHSRSDHEREPCSQCHGPAAPGCVDSGCHSMSDIHDRSAHEDRGCTYCHTSGISKPHGTITSKLLTDSDWKDICGDCHGSVHDRRDCAGCHGVKSGDSWGGGKGVHGESSHMQNSRCGYCHDVTRSSSEAKTMCVTCHPGGSLPQWNGVVSWTYGDFVGTVRDTLGAALSGASVSVSGGGSATSDAVGKYAFRFLEPGAYTLTAAKSGYASQAKTVTAVADTTVTVDFALRKLQGTASGQVKDANGVGISGALVSVTGDGTRATDAGGFYSFTLAPGTYSLTASKAGLVSQTKSAAVVDQQTTTTDFTLATTPLNLALNKTASASSQYSSTYSAAKAVDGGASTYWRSSSGGTQWLKVDLGSAKTISKVIVNWNSSYYARSFRIDVSSDNSSWSQVYSTSSGSSGIKTITFTGTSRRYVRLYCTSANSSSYRVNEFEVHSP